MTILQNRLIKNILIYAALTAAILLPRIVELDRFVTVDEPVWITHSANFYYALGQRDFASTFQEYHPGVPIMWTGMTGMLAYFPEYRALQQGYLHALHFGDFLEQQGQSPYEYLVFSRTVLVIVITAALLLAFAAARKLLGVPLALIAFLFIALDPFHIGHSRLMTQEGLFSVFILLSLLCLLAYLLGGRQFLMLLFAGAAAGLAALTKSPGIILIPFTGMLLFVDLMIDWRSRRELAFKAKLASGWRRQARPLLLWALALLVTYFALWPAMWVNPLETFEKVYGAAANYVTTGGKFNTPEGGYDLSLLRFNPAGFLNGLLWHTTPAQWAGFLLAAFSLPWLYRRKDWVKFVSIASLAVFGYLFILMMSASRSASYPRYIMSAFLCLDVIAALGIAAAADWLKQRPAISWGARVFPVLAAALLAVQALASASAYPYYFNYYNSLLGGGRRAPGRTMVGYGEVLDQAGRYLSQKPNAEELSAMSWMPIGPFSYFFDGETEPIFVGFKWTQEKADVLKTLDYLVIYIGNDERGETRELVASLEGVTPEHTIVVNEIEYVKIYKVSELPDEVFVIPEE